MRKILLCFFLLIGWSTLSIGETPPDRIEQLTRALTSETNSEFNSLEDSQYTDTSNEFYPIALKYVNREKLNIRNAPISGRVVGYLKRGNQVLIYDRNGEWEKISKEYEAPQWVSSKLLCSSDNCYATSVLNSHSSFSSKLPVRSNRMTNYQSSNKAKTSAGFSSGSCPCSGVNNCVGPRGGIYCITSGGNKRYR